MTINRLIFTNRGSRWSPFCTRLPEPVCLAIAGGAVAGCLLALAVWVAI